MIVDNIAQWLRAAWPNLQVVHVRKNPQLNSVDIIYKNTGVSAHDVESTTVDAYRDVPCTNWITVANMPNPDENILRLWFPRTVH
jgi:hypothetical protein